MGKGAAIGGIVSGLSGLGSSLIDRRTTRKEGQRQRKHELSMAEIEWQRNKEMAEWTYDQNLQQWHRENLYNTPEAQMQRFLEAGLNPNLIYGRGESGNAGSSPQLSEANYQAPRLDYPTPPAMNMGIQQGIGAFLDIQTKSAQADLVRNQAKLAGEESGIRGLQKWLMALEGEKKGFDLGLDKTYSEAERKYKIDTSRIGMLEKMQEYLYKTGEDIMSTNYFGDIKGQTGSDYWNRRREIEKQQGTGNWDKEAIKLIKTLIPKIKSWF